MTESVFEPLLDVVSRYLSDSDYKTLIRACEFAKEAHDGQTRESGEAYISHPIAVATILAELGQDLPTIIAAVLHDTVEDCDVSIDDVKSEFGDDVSGLVEGVTKLAKFSFSSKEEAQAENYRKMLVAMAEDVRVIIIKLADRLHNMQTLKHLREDKQRRIAQETRDIYAPLAHRLGMASLKWELEDLSFFYLEPEAFQEIKNLVVSKREEREQYIDRFISKVEGLLGEHSIKAKIEGRPKHFWSIFKKLQAGSTTFDELYDMLGIRVYVEELQDCYGVLGVVHSTFKPVPGRIKDYIAVPKSNMYQSLHTTILGPEGKPVEIQIRTHEMHHIAEFGVAAHWNYKEGKSAKRPDSEFVWLRQMMEMQQEQQDSPDDFLRDLKTDLFTVEVFVYTPQGDIKVLTQGATALDFAYSVHTDVGHKCQGAKVNGHIVPLHYELQNGDQVEIITHKNQKPHPDWLNIVASSRSRNKIKQWLKKEQHDDLIQSGRDKLEGLLIAEGLGLEDFLNSDYFESLSDRHQIKTTDHIFLHIAQGDISVREIVRQLTKDKPKEELEIPTARTSSKRHQHEGVIVTGERGIKVTFAKCCSPLPGDDIEGIVTLGKGVSVHRSDCHNILSMTDEVKTRLVDVEWDTSDTRGVYNVTLIIEGFDRIGIMQDILHKIADHHVNVTELKTKSDPDNGRMISTIVMEMHNINELDLVKRSISQLSDVYAIRRGA